MKEPKRNRFHSLCPYFAMFPESFVEWVEDRVRLNWDWYRAVSRLLQRRHLLAPPGSGE